MNACNLRVAVWGSTAGLSQPGRITGVICTACIQSGETSPATGAIPEAESYRKEWRSWPQYMCYRKPVDASVRVSVFCWLTPQVLWWCEQPKPHEKLESPIGRG